MPSVVSVTHAVVPGRVRCRVAGLYRNRRLRAAIEQEFSGFGGVSVNASELTGTVLIVSTNGRNSRAVVAHLTVIVRQHGNRPAPERRTAAAKPAGDEIRNRVLRWFRKRSSTEWHALAPDRAVALLRSNREGLSTTEAQTRLQRYGPNTIARAPQLSRWRLFARQLQSLPVALLGAAALLAIVTNALADAAAIVAVVAVNAVVGYVTERRSERIIHAFADSTTGTALVVRDGQVTRIDAAAIVPGDVCVLQRDAFVHADARLLECNQLTADESALTGESVPVLKSVLPSAATAALADRLNMVYRGTFITGGSGYALVVATGAETEVGVVQQAVESLEDGSSPIHQQMDRLGRELTIAAVAVCGGVMAIGLLRGLPLLQIVRTSLSLAVSAIPEGLPAVATATMAFAIGRLREQGVIVRRLSAVETLGSVQTLCLDKTGTLTENRMTVISAAVAHRSIGHLQGTVERMRERGSPLPLPFGTLFRLAALSTEVHFNSANRFEGSPTELALVEAAVHVGIDVEGDRTRHPIVEVIHRSEAHNLMCTVHEMSGAVSRRVRLAVVKGNPEELLARCTRYFDGRRKRQLSDAARRQVLSTNDRIAGQALRVLGVGYCWMGMEASRVMPDGFTWVGLIGMADRIRPGTRELIATLHRASVRTVMITGDQPGTAAAVARAIGISGAEPLEIVESSQLTDSDDAHLDGVIARAHAFARVSPSQKLQIVRALQRAGQVVGMTGDGVNDGPALKAANLGIVIGGNATDLAKQVATLVVPDAEPARLRAALLEGRAVHRNIRRSIHFLAATNFSETALIAAGIAIGQPEVLTPRQLLWINLVSDLWPSLALALEPPSDDLIDEPPSSEQRSLVSRREFSELARQGAVLAGGAMSAYAATRAAHSSAAPTTAFVALTTSQLLQAWIMRGPSARTAGKHVDVAVTTSLLIQAVALVWPPLRSLMGMTRLGMSELLRAVGCAVLPAAFNLRRPPVAGLLAAESVAGQQRSREFTDITAVRR